MRLENLYTAWRSGLDAINVPETDRHIRAARQLTSFIGMDGWDWLRVSLRDPSRKWFVATMFKALPVPRRLLEPMLHAAVLEKNPSFNRTFIEPCVRSYGSVSVLLALLRHLQSGPMRRRLERRAPSIGFRASLVVKKRARGFVASCCAGS